MALGKYAVDYEMRVDYDRLRKERLQRAKDQISKDGLGALITWDKVIAYAVGHGLGLTLHDRPFITMVIKISGYPPTTIKEGMCIAQETYTGHKGGKDGVRLEKIVVRRTAMICLHGAP